jgi:hypothetical protein
MNIDDHVVPCEALRRCQVRATQHVRMSVGAIYR